MAVTSGSDYWIERLRQGHAQFWPELGRNTLNGGFPFGTMTAMMGEATGSVIGTVGRFGSGLIKGAAGIGYLHDRTSSMASAFTKPGMMFGRSGLAGGAMANFTHGVGQTIGGGVFQVVDNLGRFGVELGRRYAKSTGELARGLDKFLLTDMGPNDKIGLFGKKVKPWIGWTVPLGVAAAGLGKGMLGYWDRYAESKAVNGPMDTEGVDLAPGSVNPSYSPLLPRIAQNRVPDNMGANAEIVLAGHAVRNQGWLR